MQLTVTLPSDVVEALGPAHDVARQMVEALAADGYRRGRLSSQQVRQWLGYDTPMQVDDLLARFGVARDYTFEDMERDAAASRHARLNQP